LKYIIRTISEIVFCAVLLGFDKIVICQCLFFTLEFIICTGLSLTIIFSIMLCSALTGKGFIPRNIFMAIYSFIALSCEEKFCGVSLLHP
jgi:hypothetical protein